MERHRRTRTNVGLTEDHEPLLLASSLNTGQRQWVQFVPPSVLIMACVLLHVVGCRLSYTSHLQVVVVDCDKKHLCSPPVVLGKHGGGLQLTTGCTILRAV